MAHRHPKKISAILILIALGVVLFCPAWSGAEQQLTMTFVGDVTLGGENRLQELDDSFTGFAHREGHDYFLENVRSLFSADDITVINLEGTLTDSAAQENREKTYRFRADTDLIDVLTGSSVEACCIANNHTMDFGNQGFRSTHEVLDKAGIGYFGRNEVYIWEGKGLRIGFVAIPSEELGNKHELYEKKIASLKEQGLNAVIVSLHMGAEYRTQHNSSQTWAATKMIGAGADLIIMHHPHVLQGIDVIGNRTVFYSLGNFCFGGNRKVRALESMIVSATLTFSDDGTYLGQQFTLYPAHISGDELVNDFHPFIVTGSEAEKVMALVQNDTAFSLPEPDADTGTVDLPYLPAKP